LSAVAQRDEDDGEEDSDDEDENGCGEDVIINGNLGLI
jgi:hypothetical protein